MKISISDPFNPARVIRGTLLQIVMLVPTCAVTAEATTWTALDFPGAGNTYAFGIDGTNVVGEWWTTDFSAGPFGYNYDGATWSPRQFPDSAWTRPYDVDGSHLAGAYSDGSSVHGFFYNGATWQSLDYPGSIQTFVYGVDGANVVGEYGPLGSGHGFLYDGANWSAINYPGAGSTIAWGISGTKIVGRYNTNGTSHGFLRDGSTWTTIDYPGADSTYAFKIDGSNIVGSYFKNDAYHGFFYDGVNWTTLDFPGAMWTEVLGVSGSKVVGIYTDASGVQHGFLATVSDKDTFESVGDFNQDGFVDAADYVVWRKGLGSIYSPVGYDVWRAHFGLAITIGSGAANGVVDNGSVPEPATAVLIAVGIALCGVTMRRRSFAVSQLVHRRAGP